MWLCSHSTIRIAQVDLAMITLRLLNYAFGGVEEDFGLDENILVHEGILMYLPHTVVADIDDLVLLKCSNSCRRPNLMLPRPH